MAAELSRKTPVASPEFVSGQAPQMAGTANGAGSYGAMLFSGHSAM
jgi:hypothetical protein